MYITRLICAHYRPILPKQSANESHPPSPLSPADGNHHTLDLEGQWCHDMANGVGRFQHGDGDASWIHGPYLCTAETQKSWKDPKYRPFRKLVRERHGLKGGGFISTFVIFCVGFISKVARLSGPVRTILLLKESATCATSGCRDYRYQNPFCLCEFTVWNFKYVQSKSKFAVCMFHGDLAGLCFFLREI